MNLQLSKHVGKMATHTVSNMKYMIISQKRLSVLYIVVININQLKLILQPFFMDQHRSNKTQNSRNGSVLAELHNLSVHRYERMNALTKL